MARYGYEPDVDLGVLTGKTITAIDGGKGDEKITFTCSDGKRFAMEFFADCCSSCTVEDVCGDLSDLIGTPIVRAEAPSSMDGYEDSKRDSYDDSWTWTFYILGTAKGTVTIRWYGSSNGYYCETPTFYQVKEY